MKKTIRAVLFALILSVTAAFSACEEPPAPPDPDIDDAIPYPIHHIAETDGTYESIYGGVIVLADGVFTANVICPNVPEVLYDGTYTYEDGFEYDPPKLIFSYAEKETGNAIQTYGTFMKEGVFYVDFDTCGAAYVKEGAEY